MWPDKEEFIVKDDFTGVLSYGNHSISLHYKAGTTLRLLPHGSTARKWMQQGHIERKQPILK